ncbi:MAG: hypothetical protein AAF821_25280 [Cyanobacteria bacterium P01_D01_bin.156]
MAPPLGKGSTLAVGDGAKGIQVPLAPQYWGRQDSKPPVLGGWGPPIRLSYYKTLGLLLVLQTFFPLAALASARIVTIQRGTVQVQRRGSSGYETGRVGTRLNPGDAILPSRRARVLVQCPGSARGRRVRAGRLSGLRVICPNLLRSTDPRGDSSLPQLLEGRFPFKPQVLGTVPRFYWPGLAGTPEYQVQLLQQTYVQPESADEFSFAAPELVETVVWEATVNNNSLLYSGPEFEPEGRYRLRVMVGDELHYGVVFEGLALDQRDEVSAAIAAVVGGEQLVEQALPVAYLQLEQELFWEMVSTLRPAVEAGGASAEMHRLLAESYLQLGLYGLAETHFGTAVALADEGDDLRTRAEGWVGLAKVAAAQQDEALVRQRLEMAQVLYGVLEEDEGWGRTIEEWLVGLAE